MSEKLKIVGCGIATQLTPDAVGSKVLNLPDFMGALEQAILAYPMPANGQGYIMMPPETFPLVSAGVGRKAGRNPRTDYVTRDWRGSVTAFLRREYAEPTKKLAVIVYTTAGYLNDPDLKGNDTEIAWAKEQQAAGVTHIIVAVLADISADAGRMPFSAAAIRHNLAGGNNEWTPRTLNNEELALRPLTPAEEQEDAEERANPAKKDRVESYLARNYDFNDADEALIHALVKDARLLHYAANQCRLSEKHEVEDGFHTVAD